MWTIGISARVALGISKKRKYVDSNDYESTGVHAVRNTVPESV